MMKGAWVNELGMITCLGSNPAETLSAVLDASKHGFVQREDLRDRMALVGEVTAELPPLEGLPPKFASRNNQLALAALQQIEPTVRKAIERYGSGRVGVVIGSSTSGILEGGAAIAALHASGHFPENYRYSQQEIGNPSSYLRWQLGINGPAYTVSTACTSGAKAMIAAARLIQAGLCDAVVTGGVDSLCPLTVTGFTSLESVSEQGCNPFSVNRDGITIGEGAALFLMSREKSAVALRGWGESLDAHHISAPDPTGAGAEIAIRAALDSAGIDVANIDYINLHGTGTEKNDLMESGVTSRLFGNRVPASSTKGLLGHTLGAAGAIEAGLCWLLLKGEGDRLPPHAWDGCVDPALSAIRLCDRENHARPKNGWKNMLSSSFAFGGSNAVLVLGA